MSHVFNFPQITIPVTPTVTAGDTYDESTTIDTTTSTVLENDAPVESGTIEGGNDKTGDITLTWDNGFQSIIPAGSYGQIDMRVMPKGRVRASCSTGPASLSIRVTNSVGFSPNAPKRATALIRAMEAAAGVRLSAAYDAAVRALYYELDRLGFLRTRSGLYLRAAQNLPSALIDWTSLTLGAAFNSPSFAAGKGITYDGVSQYVNNNRKLSDSSLVSNLNASMGVVAADSPATQLGKYALGDGAFAIGPYRTASLWSVFTGASSGDSVTAPAKSGDLYIDRRDAASSFASFNGGDAQRMERAARTALSTSSVLEGANSTFNNSGTPSAGTFWAGNVKASHFGPPVGFADMLAVRTAINKYLATVGAIV